MLERLKSRWALAGLILLVLGVVSAACIQIAPRVLPSLSAIAPRSDDSLLTDAPVQVNLSGAAAKPTPGPGQAVVTRASIGEVLTVNGRVAGANETVVMFPASGQVKAIDVKLGDTVKQGDTLVETDAQDLKTQILQAQSALETASIRLDQAHAQAAADSAGQQRDAAQQARDAASQRQAVVSDAQAALHRAQANLDKVQAGPSDSDVRAAQAGVTSAQAAAQRAEGDLAKLERGPDPTLVRAAQAQLDTAQAEYDKAQGALDALAKGADPAVVRSAQRDVDRATAALRAAQAIPIDAKDPHADKTRADKDSAVASAEADVQGAQDRLTTVQRPPSSADLTAARGSVQSARTKLDAATQVLADLQAGPDQAAIDQAQALVDNAHLATQSAEDHLTEVTSHPTPQERQAAQDQVKAAQAALDRANAVGSNPAPSSDGSVGTAYNLVLLEKDVARNQALVDSLQQDLAASMVTAPFAGIITGIQVHVDDRLTKDAPVVTLAKPGNAVVALDLTAAEGAKVMAGQAATVKLDTMDTKLDASVASVQDASAARNSRVGQLRVNWQGDVPPYGTFAQVQLRVNHKDDALVVPKKAVHTAGQRHYVQIQSGSMRKIVNVDIGIVSSDSTEITGGLTEGQIVYVGP